jgi:hypothetical protein
MVLLRSSHTIDDDSQKGVPDEVVSTIVPERHGTTTEIPERYSKMQKHMANGAVKYLGPTWRMRSRAAAAEEEFVIRSRALIG